MQLYLILFVFFLMMGDAFASPYRLMTKSRPIRSYQHHLQLESFTTEGRYDVDGNATTLGENEVFERLQTDYNYRFAQSSTLELRFGGRYRYQTSENSLHSVSEGAFESYWAGMTYFFPPVGRWGYSFDAQFRNTAYNTESFTPSNIPANQVALGDAGTELTIGGYLTYRTTSFHSFQLYGAYNRPPNELSHELIYRAESAWSARNWAFYVGAEGVSSLNQDEFADAPNTKPQITTSSSNLYNSINRSYLKPHLGVNLEVNKWLFGVRGATVVQGTSTDEGTEILFTVAWSSKGTTDDEIKIEKFKEYIIEATVIKVSPRGVFVKIDQGIAQDVRKGMKVDIFKTDFFGGNKLAASGVVYQLGVDWAIVRLMKRYNNIDVEKGFTARGK